MGKRFTSKDLNRWSFFFLAFLVSLYAKAQAPSFKGGFQPMLVAASVSADMLNPGDDLIVILTWQNIGGKGSPLSLRGFVELQFGHQRIEDQHQKFHRYYYEVFPDPLHWEAGDVWTTSCKIPIKDFWGGSYQLITGLCDSDNNAYLFKGKNGRNTSQELVGEVQIGWGLGAVSVINSRNSYRTIINSSLPPIQKKIQLSETRTIADDISVKLSAKEPRVLSITGKNNASFIFESNSPAVRIRDLVENSTLRNSENLVMRFRDSAISSNASIYLADVFYQNKHVIKFRLRFAVKGSQLNLTLSNVWEDRNFELLEISWPTLVSITGDDAHLVDFVKGGRLVPVEQAPPMGFTYRYDVRAAAAMYNKKGLIAVEATCIDDKIQVSVQQHHKGKLGALGVILTNRVEAKLPGLASIKVLSDHSVSIDLMPDEFGQPSWQSAARFWQTNIKGKNHQLYNRALVYKMVATYGPPSMTTSHEGPGSAMNRPPKTFDEILANAKKLFHLFDSVKQILYVVGFQNGGHDNSYPYTLQTDPRSGSVNDLKRCINEAKKYNTVFSMHDNFDDAYVSSRLDTNLLARDAYGRLWKGWIWAGGQSYNISPLKYALSGKMHQRVKETIDTYGIHTSYHTDVLSSEVLRYDFTPGQQAGADLSMKNKMLIPKEFNKYGIDLTSETLIHPLVGHIGYAWSTRDKRYPRMFPGETYIPLTAMVYHGTIGYSESFEGNDHASLMWGLLKGSGYSIDDLTPSHAKQFYLLNIPTGLLYGKKMKDFSTEKSVYTAEYDDSTWVKCDIANNAYEVMVNGSLIAKNWSTFAPGFKADSYLAYSADGGLMNFPAPEHWDDDIPLQATILTAEGEGKTLDATVRQRKFLMQIPANTPVRITVKKREL